MADEREAGAAVRYSFQPLETRGVLLGLDVPQLVTIGSGLLVGLVTHAVVGGSPGAVLAVLTAIAALTATFWRVEGIPLAVRLVVLARQRARASRGPVLSTLPPAGTAHADRPRPLRAGARGAALRVERSSGPEPFGVLVDRRSGSRSAVFAVTGSALSLLDEPDQAARLDAWRSVLATVGRSGSPVRRLQLVARSWNEPLGTGAAPPAGTGRQVDSYRRLLQEAPDGARHGCWLLLGVRDVRGRSAAVAIEREGRLVEGQLRRAGLRPSGPLGAREVARLTATGASEAMAVREHWDCVRVDDWWHSTFWVAEWPRFEVGPAFLTPLLRGASPPARTSLSLLMSPIPPEQAMRQVRSARTADLADEQLRRQAGFLPSARRDREREGASRREAELSEGHCEFRFSAYVTVSVRDREELESACGDLAHKAQSSHLELRRLYGRQREALEWTTPLGRGLR